MTSSYVNDLRLNEMATGDASGTWGTVTNTNLELIGEALGYGTEAITTNADTHTSTVADGSTDPARAMFIKYTGTLDSTCTITIAPNTLKRLHFIHNATSGSQSIIIKQGSGATITIPTGDTKAVYLDGAGSGAAVTDAFASLSVVDLKVQDDLSLTSDSAVLNIGADNDLKITHDGTNGDFESAGNLTFDVAGDITLDADGGDILLNDGGTNFGVISNSSSDLQISSNIADKDIKFVGQDGVSSIVALTLDMSEAGAATFNDKITAVGTSVFTNLDISGDIDVDGTTNLDVVDIDGAVNIAADVTIASTNKIIFNDASQFIQGASATVLDIAATDEIELTATLIDVVGNQTISGTLGVTGVLTANGGAVFNEGGADVDFRVESDTIDHALFVDGATGSVGIGTSIPATFGKLALAVAGTTTPTTADNVKGSSINLYAETNGATTNSTVGIFGWQGSAPGIGSGIGFSRENGSDWGSQIRFYTHPPATSNISDITERMRIDSSGNVGIGTSSPYETLRVAGTIKIAPANQTGTLAFGGTADASVAIGIFRGAPNSLSAGNSLNLAGYDNITFSVSNAVVGSQTEHMRIDVNGALCINRTDQENDERLAIFGNVGQQCMSLRQNGTVAYDMVNIINGNGQVGTIQTSGSATSYNTSSDYRLKENVVTEWDATTRLKQLKPSRFNFIADADTTVDGFLAHEVQEIVPEAISGTKDAVDADGNPKYQGIDQSKLVPLLVKTIQELEARITALENGE
jgi:hypothetical protein